MTMSTPTAHVTATVTTMANTITATMRGITMLMTMSTPMASGTAMGTITATTISMITPMSMITFVPTASGIATGTVMRMVSTPATMIPSIITITIICIRTPPTKAMGTITAMSIGMIGLTNTIMSMQMAAGTVTAMPIMMGIMITDTARITAIRRARPPLSLSWKHGFSPGTMRWRRRTGPGSRGERFSRSIS
jgi:hypothetical protein